MLLLPLDFDNKPIIYTFISRLKLKLQANITMSKGVIHAIIALTLLVGACQPKEVSPDLTTALSGQHQVDYLIVDFATNQTYSGGPEIRSLAQFTRKNNNTLMIGIQIQDSNIQLNDFFQATVSPGNLSDDGLLIPGLESRYKLSYQISNKSSGVGEINLYKDGKIRGSIGYVNKDGYTVSVGILP